MKPLTAQKQLDPLAKKYVWWEKPQWAYEHPTVFLGNVMNQGTWDDITMVRQLIGDRVLKQALIEAPPGYYSYRSWDYWHLKFGITPIPPLPRRKFE